MSKRNQSKVNGEEQGKEKVYAPRRGHPRKDPVVADADAAASRALIQSARIGAGVVYFSEKARREERGSSRRISAPKEMSDASLAQVLERGSCARGVQKLASGEHQIDRRSSAKVVQQIIESGLLPRRALRPLARDAGHARLMAPFEPLMDELRALGACAKLNAALSLRLKRHVSLYRAAVNDLAELESEERQSFQAARTAAAKALLKLRRSDDAAPVDEIFDISRQAASKVAKLLAVIDRLKSLHFQIKPAPRSLASEWGGGLLPVIGANGEPDFESLFAWLSENAGRQYPNLDTALALYRELLGCTPPATMKDAAGDTGLAPRAEWKLLGLFPTSKADIFEDFIDPEPWELIERWDDGEFVDAVPVAPACVRPSADISQPVFGSHLPAAEQRYIRRLRRSVGDVGVKKLLLLAMVERWYATDDEPGTVESDFEDRLFAVCAWVSSEFPGSKQQLAYEKTLESMGRPIGRHQASSRPSRLELKLLIRDLFRSGVRQMVELNADIPQATQR